MMGVACGETEVRGWKRAQEGEVRSQNVRKKTLEQENNQTESAVRQLGQPLMTTQLLEVLPSGR